jgi:acetyltransferase-like isoleucine patch superfamily enzyme
MGIIGKLVHSAKFLNWKTVRFNFHYFELSTALKFPVYVNSKVVFKFMQGEVKILSTPRPGMIRIGYGDVGIFDSKRSRTIWEVRGLVEFEGNAHIGHGSKISVGKEGALFCGDHFNITAETSIVAFKKIVFGKHCLLSWDILILDTDFHQIRDSLGELLNKDAPILIGNNVWIGSRCTILKGTVIPDGCVIGAQSLVNSSLNDAYTLYAGVPERAIKSEITWQY